MKFPTVLALIAAVLICGVILGHGYELMQLVLPAGWVAAMVLNLVIAMAAGVWLWRANPRAFSWRTDQMWLGYGPPIVILAGSLLLALTSRLFFGDATSQAVQPVVWAWVLVIPLVEELAFRVGFGHFFRKYGGWMWGAWFSAALFAWVHTQPTIPRVLAGELGIPLGPFLLGLVCEYLYVRTGSIWPIILMHAACNGTVILFSLLDARWFRWLGLLYS